MQHGLDRKLLQHSRGIACIIDMTVRVAHDSDKHALFAPPAAFYITCNPFASDPRLVPIDGNPVVAMLSPELTRLLSYVVLATAAAAFAATAWRNARSTHFRPAQYHLYLFGLVLTRVLWRGRVVGRMSLPATGGAVVVSNHRSPVDPAFVALACLRSVSWMVAGEYFSVPVFGTMLKTLDSIPTRRGGIDTAAVKQTIRAARNGGVVGVFPEGRINTTDELLLPLRSGAVLIALEARVPIVPCYIEGSPYDPKVFYRFLVKPAKTTITVGPVLDISAYYDRKDDRNVHDELTRLVGREIAKLAGRPDYVPQMVGRRRGAAVADAAVVEDADVIATAES